MEKENKRLNNHRKIWIRYRINTLKMCCIEHKESGKKNSTDNRSFQARLLEVYAFVLIDIMLKNSRKDCDLYEKMVLE